MNLPTKRFCSCCCPLTLIAFNKYLQYYCYKLNKYFYNISHFIWFSVFHHHIPFRLGRKSIYPLTMKPFMKMFIWQYFCNKITQKRIFVLWFYFSFYLSSWYNQLTNFEVKLNIKRFREEWFQFCVFKLKKLIANTFRKSFILCICKLVEVLFIRIVRHWQYFLVFFRQTLHLVKYIYII